MPLTIEQQRALAIAQAKRKRAEAEAGPSLRSETDAIIEEAAANIPGGYEAFNRKPADPQRMAAMGYVQDPLAKSGYAKPRAPEAPTVNTAPSSNYLTDVVRGLEAPIVGLTGGGFEGWAKTTAQDPVLGATQAVEFISPVDDAARAYQGLKQAGAGLIDGDMQKAAEGAQQFAIDGSFTAMQALPGSMTLRGVTGVATPGRNTLALNMADLERSAVQATRAPPVRKAPPAPVVAAEPPKPFSAPAEPAGGGLVRRNADRFFGGAVGATIGGAGDAYAAPADGEGNGGPLNAGTGAAIGFFGPRAVASAASRGFRAAARPFRPAGMDERVAARAVRNALKAGGITNADEASAAFTARFGDKPAAIADLTQEGVSTAAGLSRRAGATGEAARARGEELLQNRAGRLERDIGQANPNLNPATITGDVERMVALAQEQAQPAYSALRQGYPLGSLTSPRLEQLSQIDSMAPHIKAVNDYRATTAATEGRVVGDFEYWDLVKRDIDAKEQQLIAAGATMDDIRLRKLEDTRNALVQELDTLVPDYPAARQLGGEAPKMRESMRQGQRILGQYQTAEEVARLVAGITGQAQLTALQAGVIRSMVQKTEGATGAMASLMSAGSRRKLSEVFGPEAAEALQARFAADAAIVQNAQRINPNIGSVTSQAQMGEGGLLPMAAEAIRAFRSPIEATLAAMSKGGAYSKAQRDLMGQMLLEGATPENLARIFGNRGGRGGRPAPPPPPTGGGAGPARGPTVPPAPTGAAPRARPAPSEEAVLSAMAQVTQPAKGRPMVGPPTRDTIWDGPIPTKPQSLRGWIRSQGGINDRNYMTGDMKAVMGRANGMPGLINRESGTGLDELARKAYQEGFDVDPEDAGTLMRLLEEEFAGSPSYRIGAKEEWDAYQDTLRARRGNVPGQTSSSPPMIGGAALGALTSGGATYAATGDEDLAFKAGILGGIGGGVVGSRLAKGSTPKPPAVKPRPGPPGVKPPPVKNGFGSRDLPMDEASRKARAEEQGFDTKTRWYHGTARLDRLLEKPGLNPKRATSGPMPFFTDDPAMASSYAMGKKGDTSMPDYDVTQSFTVEPKYLGHTRGRTPYSVEQSWNYLAPEQKRTILERAKRVGWADPDTSSGPLKLHPEGVDASPSSSHFDWLMKTEARGNPITALRMMWHDGGILYGAEDQLKEVFKLAGYPHPVSTKNAPWTKAEGVLPVYMRMSKPLQTDNAAELQNIITQLRQDFARDRSVKKPYGADMWDKSTRHTPREWVEQLAEDVAKGENSFVWTSIPDKVTNALKRMGYDGIIDTGGKMGGNGHRVAIPFSPTNVRSINAKFDPSESSSSKLLAGMSGNAEAIGAGTGAVFAPDADGDGEISFGERAGAAITGGVLGNVARRASGTGAPKVKPPPAGKFRGPSQQTFAGVNAKTADKVALARAQNMEAEGASRDAIWDETGWFKGVDGKWRFEIDDSASEYSSYHGKPFMRHKPMYQAYDDLRDVRLIDGKKNVDGGAYIPKGKYSDEMIAVSGSDKRSVALHEYQHGIQQREGFADGGQPDEFSRLPAPDANDALVLKKFIERAGGDDEWQAGIDAFKAALGREPSFIAKTAARNYDVQTLQDAVDPYQAYRRLSGETEARNVQTRRDFTPAERRARPPWTTEDVPDDQQIVRFGSGKAESRPKPPAPRNAPPKGPSFPPRLAADLNKSKVSPATRATLDQNAALPPGERKSVMEATGWNDEILRIAAPYIRPGSRMESEVGNRIARLVEQANANPVEYALRQTMAKGAYEEAQKRFKQASGARSRAARNLEDLRSRNMLNPNQPATQQQLTVHKQRRDDAEQFLSEAARLRDEAKVMLDRADVELMSLTQVRDFANKEIQRITDALGGQRPKASATAMLPAYNPLGPPRVGGAASLLPPKPPGGRPSKRAADELAHLLFEQDMAEEFAKIQSGEITPTQRNTFQQVMSWYARHPSLAAVSAVAAGGSVVGYAALATDQGERAVQARENARKRSGQPEPELPGPPAWDWEKLSRNPRFAGDTQAALQALGYKIGKIDNNIRRADGKRTESEKALYHFLWTMDNTRDPEAPPTEAEWDALKEAALQARRRR